MVSVEMTRNGMTQTGKIAARREKTRQIYVIVDHESSRYDNWYPEGLWTEVESE